MLSRLSSWETDGLAFHLHSLRNTTLHVATALITEALQQLPSPHLMCFLTTGYAKHPQQ